MKLNQSQKMIAMGLFCLFNSLMLFFIVSRHDDSIVEDAYRFETADQYALQFAERIAATDTASMEYQFLLMDVTSRAHSLRCQGDSLLADFFYLSVQNYLHENQK